MIETRVNIVECAAVLHAAASELMEEDPKNADEILKKFEDTAPLEREGSP